MSQLNEENDKRKYIRHPVAIPIEIDMENVAVCEEECLTNISSCGLCFKSRQNIAEGKVINIRIPFVKPVFEGKGRVVWCTRVDDHYDVGVEFIETNIAFRARMVEQICYIEQYKKDVFEKTGKRLTAKEAALEWIRRYAEEFPL